MSNEFRPHIVMGVIILILALALIVLSFVPKQVQFYQTPPGGKGQISSSNQQARIVMPMYSLLE